MQLDDEAGGTHHTHDWAKKGTIGHIHNLGQPEFPFIVTDNELPNKMRIQFFTKLTNLPQTGKLWFVEWAGGINTNPPDDPTSCIDYSYATVKRMLLEGSLPDGWLKRVKAIIHLEANYPVRFALNQKSSIPSSIKVEAIAQGTAFWQKDERVLRFYGLDDFVEIEGQLKAAGISIYPLNNDGGGSFYKILESIADELFKRDKVIVGKPSIFL